MKPAHVGLALTVILLWTLSFLAVKLSLRDVPPLALSTVRMMLVSLPWVLWLPRPKVPLPQLALYGVFMFALQLGLLAAGIYLGVPAGLAAVLLQLQVFVTAGLAALVLGERTTGWQAVGALISFCGLVLVAMHAQPGKMLAGEQLSLAGVVLLVLAASAWGTANIISKRLGPVNLLALIAWGSLFAWPPLLLAALAIEGPHMIWRSFSGLSGVGVSSVLYMTYFGTFLAFGLWSKLLSLYPATQIAPFTLLVPVLTMLLSAPILGEPLLPWKLGAAGMVLSGVIIVVFGARLFASLQRVAPFLR